MVLGHSPAEVGGHQRHGQRARATDLFSCCSAETSPGTLQSTQVGEGGYGGTRHAEIACKGAPGARQASAPLTWSYNAARIRRDALCSQRRHVDMLEVRLAMPRIACKGAPQRHHACMHACMRVRRQLRTAAWAHCPPAAGQAIQPLQSNAMPSLHPLIPTTDHLLSLSALVCSVLLGGGSQSTPPFFSLLSSDHMCSSCQLHMLVSQQTLLSVLITPPSLRLSLTILLLTLTILISSSASCLLSVLSPVQPGPPRHQLERPGFR